MLFIDRPGRSQSRQQLHCDAVSPPCKQVSHRSPSQSAPSRPPASWPCARPGLETQSPAQKATTAAGLPHHMLSQLQTPRCYRPGLLQDTGAQSRVWKKICLELLGHMMQLNREFPLALKKRAWKRAERNSRFLSLRDLRVRTLAHAVPSQRGGERRSKAIR